MISFVLNRCTLPTIRHSFKTIESKSFFFLKKINRINPTIQFNEKLNRNNQTVNDVEIWEIDFFSRPVVNSDGKKIWELIIVNDNQTFEHVEIIPNNLVNSKELKKRIKKVIESRLKKTEYYQVFSKSNVQYDFNSSFGLRYHSTTKSKDFCSL
mmetsp:Transcript_19453/g.40895  ORF Transcript_19453/g.40895 Transcript_19453/m.40895 type:complete len:154 (+) Transcript_19453:25-486(+)